MKHAGDTILAFLSRGAAVVVVLMLAALLAVLFTSEIGRAHV